MPSARQDAHVPFRNVYCCAFATKWHSLVDNLLIIHSIASNGATLLLFSTQVREEFALLFKKKKETTVVVPIRKGA